MMKRSNPPKILVMGAGGIGGTICGYLSEVGTDIVACTTNKSIYDAVSADGFSIQGDGNPRKVAGRISMGPPAGELFDYVFLATQPTQVEEAAKQAAPFLAENGRMFVMQNGLCEERIGDIVGPERVIGGIVAWGASMPKPGLYDRTSSGGFQIGYLSGLQDEYIRELKGLLEIVGPVTITENLLGARWSKLALNCCISSIGTIGGDRLGVLAKVRKYRRLGLEIFAEVVEVAKAENIRLEKVSGTLDLNWIAIAPKERTIAGSPNLAAKHAMLLAVGMRYRRLRSSMLSAIERGKTPAVDFLNGEVVTRAIAHGIETPINSRIVEIIHAIAAGDMRSSRDTLDQLFTETR